MTASVAVHRNWGIATDDRRAIAYLRQEAPQLAVVTTRDLLKNWADMRMPSPGTVRDVLRKIRAAKLICTTPEFDDLAKEGGLGE